MTVTQKPIRSYYEKASVKNSEVIRPLESPWRRESGLAVMKGNIARGGSVLRVSGILPHMMTFRGRAKVFTSEAQAIQYLRENQISEPLIFVLVNQGLIGAPGIQTLLPLSGEIVGSGLEEKVAIISDGRFSGGARGFCIGLVTPESAGGGELGLVREGDFISVDVEQRSINLEISDGEMARRKETFKPYESKLNSPFLASFIKSVRPLHEGAAESDVDRSQYRSLAE
jgi:dihydroxy-acid dehydratase